MQKFEIINKWSECWRSRKALLDTARFEDWTDLIAANNIPKRLVGILSDVTHADEVDVILEALYPNSTCWSDHPPVMVPIFDREQTACFPSTNDGSTGEVSSNILTIGNKRRRLYTRYRFSNGLIIALKVGTCSSLCIFGLHRYFDHAFTNNSLILLQMITAICLFYVGYITNLGN